MEEVISPAPNNLHTLAVVSKMLLTTRLKPLLQTPLQKLLKIVDAANNGKVGRGNSVEVDDADAVRLVPLAVAKLTLIAPSQRDR